MAVGWDVRTNRSTASARGVCRFARAIGDTEVVAEVAEGAGVRIFFAGISTLYPRYRKATNDRLLVVDLGAFLFRILFELQYPPRIFEQNLPRHFLTRRHPPDRRKLLRPAAFFAFAQTIIAIAPVE